MSKKLRYEEELSKQLTDLPLPDENMAWVEMEKLLEEDDDDKVIVPPPVNKGCGLWILLPLALLLLGGLWLFIRSEKKTSKNEDNREPISATQKTKNEDKIQGKDKYAAETVMPVKKNNDKTNVKANTLTGKENDASVDGSPKKASDNKNSVSKQATVNADIATKKSSSKNKSVKSKNKKTINDKGKLVVNASGADVTDNGVDDAVVSLSDLPDRENNSLTPKEHTTTIDSLKTDTSFDKKVNSLTKTADSSVKKTEKDKDSKKQKFYFAAGIAIQQMIPLDGAKAVPYNYYGRQGSLTDYIPSVYLRMYRKEKKWFVQSEFKFGAPQYTKEITYKSEVLDTSGGAPKITAYYTLKKTYYHQLPLSFNYLIKPKWSVGTGIVFNRFSGAISREDIYEKLLSGEDTLTSSKIVNDKKDSSFTKNNFQWLIETQYQWKRFYFGARYAMGLQSSIKYTDVNTGEPVKKTDNSLNIFIRYELWKSKKK